jgi:type I restriction enzyme S subunit
VSLKLDKSGWVRVSLGTVAAASKEKVDPSDGTVDRYVAGDHMDSDDLKIHRWGGPSDTDLGPAFHRRFHPGQVLYGSRRTYLRKVAVADFEGVCANTTFVVETRDSSRLLQEFLPFVMSSEPFHAFAIAESKGSVNPYVNWSDIERYEFDLPPLDEQERIAELLWALYHHREALRCEATGLDSLLASWTRRVFEPLDWSLRIEDVISPDRPLCYGVVQPGVDDQDGDGVGLIRVLDLESGRPKAMALKRVSREIDAQYRRSRVVAGDVLLSIVGTIGRAWIVTDEFVGCNIARALARIAPDESMMRADFLYWVLSSPDVQEALNSAAFESARKTLNLSVLAKLKIPRVSLAEQDRLLADRRTLVAAISGVQGELALAAGLHGSVLADLQKGN